jgi:hypothetical protein
VRFVLDKETLNSLTAGIWTVVCHQLSSHHCSVHSSLWHVLYSWPGSSLSCVIMPLLFKLGSFPCDPAHGSYVRLIAKKYKACINICCYHSYFILLRSLLSLLKFFLNVCQPTGTKATSSVFNNHLAFNASVTFCWTLYWLPVSRVSSIQENEITLLFYISMKHVTLHVST